MALNMNPYPPHFTKSTIEEGQSGDWRIEKFSPDEEDVMMYNMRCHRDGLPHRVVPPGDYTRLVYGNTTIMSDTPAEAHENRDIVDAVAGGAKTVLINGLGMGWVLDVILSFDHVLSVTVIEIDEDVIKLVGPRYEQDPRVTIIHADAMKWRPEKGTKYDAVWHDIWPTICEDNLEDMKKLSRSYGQRTKFQGCWGRKEINEMKRRWG